MRSADEDKTTPGARVDTRVTDESAAQRSHPATDDATAQAAEEVDADSARPSRRASDAAADGPSVEDRLATLEAEVATLKAKMRHWF